MAYYSPDVGDVLVYDIIQFTSLSLSLIIIFWVTILNYVRSEYMFLSYEQMVKKELDKSFAKFNKPGLQWYIVPGHYWLEVRIEPIVKHKGKPLFSEENMPLAHNNGEHLLFQNYFEFLIFHIDNYLNTSARIVNKIKSPSTTSGNKNGQNL